MNPLFQLNTARIQVPREHLKFAEKRVFTIVLIRMLHFISSKKISRNNEFDSKRQKSLMKYS